MLKKIKSLLKGERKPLPRSEEDMPCAECGLPFVAHFDQTGAHFRHSYVHPSQR